MQYLVDSTMTVFAGLLGIMAFLIMGTLACSFGAYIGYRISKFFGWTV